jgi:di/tripeptidase
MTLPPDPVIAQLAFEALRQVVAIDSQSDELSPSIPSTPGQVRLAGFLEDFYRTRVGAAGGAGRARERDRDPAGVGGAG